MVNLIQTEFIKSKRTSTYYFVGLGPVLTLVLTAIWRGGQIGAYNWWYVIFLPGLVAIISAQTITKEKSLSYKPILLYPQDKKAFWVSKVIYLCILLVISSLIFMLGMEVLGVVFGQTISLQANLMATGVLILTTLFTIPVSLLLTVQFNLFVAVIFNLALSMVGVFSYGTESFLKFSPYQSPSALMVPILGILPNGLPVSLESVVVQPRRIGLELFIHVLLFILLTMLSAYWFDKKEVN